MYTFPKLSKQKEQSMELDQHNTSIFSCLSDNHFSKFDFRLPGRFLFRPASASASAERDRCMLVCQITMSQGENENHALDRGGGELRAKKRRGKRARGRASFSMTFLRTQFLRTVPLFLFT